MSLDDQPLRRSWIKPEEVDELINQFLEKCRPRMRDLVSMANETSSFLPIWEPKKHIDPRFRKYIRSLQIPVVSGGQPSLLLHNLGVESRQMNRERAARIPHIFSFAKHTYVTWSSLPVPYCE